MDGVAIHGKAARGFRDPGKAIVFLHDLGARTVAVDMSAWRPQRRRPASLEPELDDEQAAAYDAWFRAEVEQGLKEADDPNTIWVTNEEVRRKSAERRARWLAQAAGKL
jgi:hypothetical protein